MLKLLWFDETQAARILFFPLIWSIYTEYGDKITERVVVHNNCFC